MSINLIFHSDDLGATPDITSRMLKAWENGLLDGFSIFANSDCFETIQSCLKSHHDKIARICAHLNLWEGRPILKSSNVPRLIDSDGFFKIEFMGILKYYILSNKYEKKALLNEIENEWRAQIKKILLIIQPRTLTAIDGHIHIHMIPFLFEIAAKLAKEFNIPEIRIVNEPFYLPRNIKICFSKKFLLNIIKCAILQVFVSFNKEIANRAELKYPDAMLGVLYSGLMNFSNILPGINTVRKNGAKKIEILMHIGRADISELYRWKNDKKKAEFVLSPLRDYEYECLLSLRKFHYD